MLLRVVNAFPKWLKIVLCVIGAASIVYRIFTFVDDCIARVSNKNITALICGILCFIPIVLLVFAIIDIISIAKTNDFSPIGR